MGPLGRPALSDLSHGRADGSEIESCAIITTAANDRLSAIHHRMPASIDPHLAEDWLATPETEAEKLLPLLGPSAEDMFTATPISKRVNKVAEDDAGLWDEHIVAAPPKQMDLF